MNTYNDILKVTPADKEYSELEFFNGNRIINSKNLATLIRAIHECNLLPLCPLLVVYLGGKYIIVDGQHRYMAAKELNLSFYMVVLKEPFDLCMIGRLNTNHKNWGLGDYARHWAAQLDTSDIYQEYLEYYTNNNITHGILIAIYNQTYIKLREDGGNKVFKDGKLLCNKSIRLYITERLYQLRQLEGAALNPVLKRSTLRKQQFQTAILFALSNEHFNYKRFLKNLYKRRHNFNLIAKHVDMVHEIHRIENIK